MQSFVVHVSNTGAASVGQDTSAYPDGRTCNERGARTERGSRAETAGESEAMRSDGLSGNLRLQNVQSLRQEEILQTLDNLETIIRWAQAQQARAVTRLETLVARETDPDGDLQKTFGPDAAMKIAASEVGALLSLPPMTAQRLMIDSSVLCTDCPAVLEELETGRISYRKAQIICSTVVSLPDPPRRILEGQLLAAASGLTASQLERKARRLYAGLVPEAELALRHHAARNDRRVTLEAQSDGMCFLGARLPATDGQAIFTGLTTCARAEQSAGDPRTVDQLRADIFSSLLLGGYLRGSRSGSNRCASGHDGAGEPASEDSVRTDGTGADRASRDSTGADFTSTNDANVDGAHADTHTSSRCRPPGPRVKAEVMVLINAETLAGLDNRPAELHGYGPISAESARELLRSIGHWTGLLQDGTSGEILSVGRRRQVPPGLRRWLQARDATCRFPGCSANALTAEIDHTIPWARGGATAHGNLACLCRKHHALKTAGFWHARQPKPGMLEWTSPGGRRYMTHAHLDLDLADSGRETDSSPLPPF